MTDQEALGRLNGLSLMVETALVKAYTKEFEAPGVDGRVVNIGPLLNDLDGLLKMALELDERASENKGAFVTGMTEQIDLAKTRIAKLYRKSET